jgi:hypothetical protein
VTSPALRRAELAGFALLLLALSGAFAWRGAGFLAEGAARFPLLGLTVPAPGGTVAGILYLLLAASIALATGVVASHLR